MDPIAQNWLNLQCQHTSHVTAALVLMGVPNSTDVFPMAYWPPEGVNQPLLQSKSESLFRQRKTKITVTSLAKSESSFIACPIIANGQCFGMLTVAINSKELAIQKQVARDLKMGCQWFTWLARERKVFREQDSDLLGYVDLLSLSLKHEDFYTSVQLISDALQKRLDCERVSIGMMDKGHMVIAAISGGLPGEAQRSTETTLLKAMEESVDQSATIILERDLKPTDLVTLAHHELMEEHSLHSVCTTPMIYNGNVVAAITYENLKNETMDKPTLHFYEQLALLLGPSLKLKWTLLKGVKRRSFSFNKKSKIALACAALVILGLCFVPGTYHVSAIAVVKSDKKQLLISALDGFVENSLVRPGDQVSSGQLLARLDDQDLRLQKMKWEGKLNQLRKSYNKALSSMDRTELKIVKAQIGQATAELNLVENQLKRTTLVAPFDGVVVAGDLSQSLGAPVKRGDVLYEIAPSQEFRILLKVDERDIAAVDVGQKGAIRLSSIPGENININIEKITPVSVPTEGRNFFHVEAILQDDNEERLTPGMSGIAKIDAGERPYMWIWFHRTLDWIRLLIWRL